MPNTQEQYQAKFRFLYLNNFNAVFLEIPLGASQAGFHWEGHKYGIVIGYLQKHFVHLFLVLPA